MKEHTLFSIAAANGDMYINLTELERNHPRRQYRLKIDHHANGTSEVAELGFYQVLQLRDGFVEAVTLADPNPKPAPRTISTETLAIMLRGFQGMGLPPRDSGAGRWDELPPSVVEQWERYAVLVWGAVERLTRESKMAEPEVIEAKPETTAADPEPVAAALVSGPICRECRGTGRMDFRTCPCCGGSGKED